MNQRLLLYSTLVTIVCCAVYPHIADITDIAVSYTAIVVVVDRVMI